MIVFTFLCQVRRLRHLFQVVQPRHLQRWFVLCQVGPYTKLNKLLVYKLFLTFTCFFLAFPCFSRLFHIFPVFSMLFVAFTCFSTLFHAFPGFSMLFLVFPCFSWLFVAFPGLSCFSMLFLAFRRFSMLFYTFPCFSWLFVAFPGFAMLFLCTQTSWHVHWTIHPGLRRFTQKRHQSKIKYLTLALMQVVCWPCLCACESCESMQNISKKSPLTHPVTSWVVEEQRSVWEGVVADITRENAVRPRCLWCWLCNPQCRDFCCHT